MEIKQIKAFLAVAKAKSFLAAADSLYVSRQAVSKTVTQLEDELGVKLFVRGQSGVTLTPAGSFFYPQARALAAEFDRVAQEMTHLEVRAQPKIHICMAAGVNNVFSRPLAEYSIRHTGEMDIDISTCQDSECEFVLGNYRADMVLSFTPITSKNTSTTLIREMPIVFLVNNGNPLAKNDVLELSWRHRTSVFLLYTGGRDHCLWWPVVPRQGDTVCSDLSYLFQLLREDRGILPMPEDMVPDHLDFARVLPGKPRVEPARIYCTMLRPSYYNATTYKLLEQISSELIRQSE